MKKAQRDAARAARKALDPQYRSSASEVICAQILRAQMFLSAAVVASYEWMNSEVQVAAINAAVIANGATLIVPEVLGPTSMRFVSALDRDLEIALGAASVIVVPAVGFTTAGHRIGNGRGYYDRALVGAAGLRVCVCFDAQRLDTLAIEPTDATMDVVITESGPLVGAHRWA